MTRGPPKLILRKVKIPIRGHSHRIRPSDPRIPQKHARDPRTGIEDINCILLKMTRIDPPIRVRLQAIRRAHHRHTHHAPLRPNLARRPIITQPRRRNPMQVRPAHRSPIQHLPIRRQSDAVGAAGAENEAGAGEGVYGLAPDIEGRLRGGADLGGVVEVAPGGFGAEVHGDEGVAAGGAGVGDVGYAEAGGGEGGAQVEADVVEILRRFERGWM